MSETIYYPTATGLVNSNTTVTANATIYQDLTSQGAYLIPSPSNAAVIVQWMTRLTDSFASDAVCGQPFWSNIAPQLMSNVVSSWGGGPLVNGPDGRVWSFGTNGDNRIYNFNPYTRIITSYTSGASVGNGLTGALLLRDGRVFFPSFFSNLVGLLNTASGVFTSYTQPTGWPNGFNAGGGALMVDGNVIIVPYGIIGNCAVFNTATNTTSNLVSTLGRNLFLGATTDVTGNVVMTGQGNAFIGLYNPYNGQFSTVSSPTGFWNSMNLPNGNVLCFPQQTTSIGEYNPFTLRCTTFTTTGGGNFRFGQLLPDGRAVLSNSTHFGIYNYKTKTFTSTAAPYGRSEFQILTLSGLLISSAGVNVCSTTATTRPVPPEFCMHPFFNRTQ
jgi:streptogramin lyase